MLASRAMRFAVLLLIAACEKSSGVETSGSGSSVATAAPAIVQPDASLGTTPNDAAVVASVPADAPTVSDAARRAPRVPIVAMTEEDAGSIADKLTTNEPFVGRPEADLGSQIDAIRDRNRVPTGGGAGRAGAGDARIGGGGGVAIDSSGGPKSTAPRGRVTVISKQAHDESTLTPDVVLAKVQATYMAGIKRCYRAYLEKDATARGKVKLTITVNEAGRSIAPTAVGFVKQIDDCLTNQMATWIFPRPRDRDGAPTTAAFGIDLQLVPD